MNIVLVLKLSILFKVVISRNLKEEISFENCENHTKISNESGSCGFDNFEKMIQVIFKSTHNINGSEVSFDPYLMDHVELKQPKAEATNFVLNGLRNVKLTEFHMSKNEYDDSFFIASKILVPTLNNTGDYKMNLGIGIFHFDASGEYYSESCKF